MLIRMKELLYVRTEMTIPQVGTSIHIAELQPIDGFTCELLRIIELDPSETIRGAATGGKSVGMAAAPEQVVPHPDQYADFPDITSTTVLADAFEALWAEALAKFPALG